MFKSLRMLKNIKKNFKVRLKMQNFTKFSMLLSSKINKISFIKLKINFIKILNNYPT